MQTFVDTNILNRAENRIHLYKKLYTLLKSKVNPDGTCHLSLKVLGNFLDIEPSEVSDAITKLTDWGLITSSSQHSYEILAELETSPLVVTEALLELLNRSPELSFQKQAEQLDITLADLEKIYGFFIYIIKG